MISARPPEIRSSSANCWNTRTGSSELSTVTALDSLIRSVLAAIAASATAGEEIRKSGLWCSPSANTSSPSWSASTASSIRSRIRCSGLMPELRSANVATPSSMTLPTLAGSCGHNYLAVGRVRPVRWAVHFVEKPHAAARISTFVALAQRFVEYPAGVVRIFHVLQLSRPAALTSPVPLRKPVGWRPNRR